VVRDRLQRRSALVIFRTSSDLAVQGAQTMYTIDEPAGYAGHAALRVSPAHWASIVVLAWACSACAAADNHTFLSPVAELAAPAGGAATGPNLANGPDGAVYLSWIEQLPGDTHALRFATWKSGVLSPARTITSGADWFVNWADFPTMAALPDGTLAAHWLQRSGAGRYAYDVMVSLSRDGGSSWSAPLKPHRDGTESEHGFVSMFALSDRFGVVWLDGRKHAAAQQRKSNGTGDGEDGEMTVRYTTITADGQLGEEIEVDGRACDCCQTSVAVTADGPLLVYRDRSANEIRDISVTRWLDGRWTPGQPIQADDWQVNFCPVNGPSAAAAGSRVAVAWYTAANDSPRVYVSFSNDAGAAFAQGIRVDQGAPLGRVDVQLLADDAALVSWLERTGERSADIRVRRVQGNGRTSAPATISQSSPERPSGFPQMIVHGDQVLFAWTEAGPPVRLRVASARLEQ
jgi:hypothetical protein